MNTIRHPNRSRFRDIRIVLGPAVVAILTGLACGGQSPPPSFLVILVDTLRSDYLGCYGFEGPVSPAVDALAEESYLFRKCYAPSPWTKPTIASLFTSLNPTAHGVTNHEGAMWSEDVPDLQKGVLRNEAVTLAELLRGSGYRTGAFVANPWLTADYGFGQGFEVYDDSIISAPAETVLAGAGRWLGTVGPDEPFLLYLHLMEVHAPYNAPESVYELIRNSPGVQTEFVLPREHWSRIPKSLLESRWVESGAGEKRPEIVQLTTWLGRYAAGMRDLDNQLGPFLSELERSGRLESTFVILTSDHGEELYDHEYWEHGYTLYQDQIHVPLIIRPPGGLETTSELEPVVGLIDLFPTLAGLAGVAHTEVDGKDLSPLFRGTPEGGSGVVLSGAARTNPNLVALSAGAYKLILNGTTNRLALFNVDEDPGERRNLATEKPEVLEEMRGYLKRLMDQSRGRSLFAPSSEPISDERRQLLESLGYTN